MWREIMRVECAWLFFAAAYFFVLYYVVYKHLGNVPLW